MTGLERRQSPRTKVEGFAYLNLGSNNGGSVVDVSEGGLGFRSIAPVRRNGTMRVQFLEHNRHIEADGELAWVDGTEKSGGLRFTALRSETREQIRRWVSEGTTGSGGNGGSARLVREVPPVEAVRPEIAPTVVASPFGAVSAEPRVPAPLRGFSGGLVTGLMVSAVVAGAFLFQIYRRQVGESLIRLGEQFGATPQVQTQTVTPAPPTLSPAPPTPVPASQPVLPAGRAVLPAPAAVAVPEAVPGDEALAPDTVRRVAEATPARLPRVEAATTKPPASSVTSLAGKPLAAPPAVAAAAVSAPAHPAGTAPAAPAASLPVPLPTTSTPAEASLGANKTAAAPINPVSTVSTQAVPTPPANAVATSEMFFDVGKFKDEVQAQSQKDKLAQLGFPATAVQRGRLWMNAYHVLVGPYDADAEAKAARKKLSSDGFAPRTFHRGSRSLTVISGLTLNGAPMPSGDYTISWESYVSDATVKVVRGVQVMATADGKWVKRGVRYPQNAYMYRRNGDGSRTLIEIRFAGMDQALVFGQS